MCGRDRILAIFEVLYVGKYINYIKLKILLLTCVAYTLIMSMKLHKFKKGLGKIQRALTAKVRKTLLLKCTN